MRQGEETYRTLLRRVLFEESIIKNLFGTFPTLFFMSGTMGFLAGSIAIFDQLACGAKL